MSAAARAVPFVGAALFLGLSAAGCIDRGYPLGPGGNVDVKLDTAGNLFAADVVDADGNGVEPRQKPSESGVTLTLTEGSEAANGGYVDVRVEPAEALDLAPDDGEDAAEPTCRAKDGKFRCTASAEGIARFVVSSRGAWSGEALLIVSWADQRKETVVDVLPAGLPPSAKNFDIVATGLANSDHVLPTYSALACTTIDSLPNDLGSKWRPGKIRSRQAFVRASAPATDPGSVANAPVIIESLSSEGALSLTEDCGSDDRVTRLRVLLSSTGESPPFYFCFSDLGGTVEISVTSGALSITPNPTLEVDPEPRVLRVAAIAPSATLGLAEELFEVTAFNTNLERIAMAVDLESSDPDVLQLTQASEMLAPEGSDPTGIVVSPLAVGKATLHVRPRLFKEPDCASIQISVIDAQ